MSRPHKRPPHSRAVMRNRDLRLVELAWGARSSPSGRTSSRSASSPTTPAATTAVGVAGPGAHAPGSRCRAARQQPRRPLPPRALPRLRSPLVGAARWRAQRPPSSLGRNEALVFGLAAVIGVTLHALPPRDAGDPALARPDARRADRCQRRELDDREPRHARRAAPRGRARLGRRTRASSLRRRRARCWSRALLLAPLHVEGVIQPTAASRAPPASIVLDGVRAVRGPARLILVLMAAQGFVRGCLNVLIVVAVFRVLDAGDGAVGYLTAGLGLGGLVGAFGAMTLRGSGLAVALGVALVFWGLPIALIAPRPSLAAAILLLAVVGAANSVEDVAGFTLLQRIVPDELLSRALGLVWGAAMGAVALGSIAAPAVVAAVGPRAAFVVVGACCPCSRCSAGAACARSTGRARPGRRARRRLRRAAVPAALARRQGAPGREADARPRRPGRSRGACRRRGDRFYIVDSGELEIVNGAHGERRPRRLLRRDRAAARRTAYGDRPRLSPVGAVRARPRRLPGRAHSLRGARGRRVGGGGTPGRHCSSVSSAA